jgi:asparagine synthase (glutamine-hydrolysing)
MCGITGVAGRAAGVAPLERMNETLRHRGPDDTGVYWSTDRVVGLAQCRLAIIDLSPGGHQPMHSDDGRTVLILNGEIYNYRELRDELAALGHTFRSTSDTEVVLAAYRQWGTECVSRLDGMFALAVHDLAANRLFLARDRAGEKPLFYRSGEGRLTFASELKALMADPTFPRQLDPDAVEMYLAYGYVPGAMCIFRGARKLPAGGALLYDLDSGQLRTWQWYTLPPPPSRVRAEEDLLDEFEVLLERAVRRQLVADVPVGVLLSGGLDSSLVTAMAARASSRPVDTFTIAFPGHAKYDEGPHARLIAEHFGTRHTELAAEAATVDLLPQLAKQCDEPMADSSIIPTFLVSSLIRKHATVALGGDGGDELFGGYPHYSWLLQQQKLRRMVPSALRAIAAGAAARFLPPGMRGRNHAIGLSGDVGNAIAHVNVYFDAVTRARLLGGKVSWRPEQFRASVADPSYGVIRRATETDFRTTMVDAYLVKVDRASMLASLEVRAPFLDHLLIDFAFGAVPDSVKVRPDARKILPRLLARRVLPPSFDVVRKQGFTMPLDAWFAGSWGSFIESTVLASGSGLFDRKVISGLLAGQRAGRNNTARLYALVMFELWCREYRVTI